MSWNDDETDEKPFSITTLNEEQLAEMMAEIQRVAAPESDNTPGAQRALQADLDRIASKYGVSVDTITKAFTRVDPEQFMDNPASYWQNVQHNIEEALSPEQEARLDGQEELDATATGLRQALNSNYTSVIEDAHDIGVPQATAGQQTMEQQRNQRFMEDAEALRRRQKKDQN